MLQQLLLIIHVLLSLAIIGLVLLQRGKGVYVYDTSGKRYLDLISGIGVNSLGYAHPRMTKVIREQAGKMLLDAKRECDAIRARAEQDGRRAGEAAIDLKVEQQTRGAVATLQPAFLVTASDRGDGR